MLARESIHRPILTSSATFDKNTGLLTVKRYACFCCPTHTQAYELKEVENLRAFKKGHEGINFYTLHYTLQAEFNSEQPPVKIWDSQDEKKINDRVSKNAN